MWQQKEEEEEAAPFAKSVTREFTHTQKVGMKGKPERRNRMHGMHDESYPHVVLI